MHTSNHTITSQNTMYCGGKPEHKRIANKCMHITMASYIELHTQNKCTCHESSSDCLQITGDRYYKFHTMLIGAQCFNNSSSASEITLISDR